MTGRVIKLGVSVLIVAGCAAAPPEIARFEEPQLALSDTRPDEPDACYGQAQTVAPDNNAGSAAETKQVWVETVCDTELTPDFVRTLQRALIVRGLLDGPVSGWLDTATRASVREFQRSLGIESGRLSVAGGKRLGLIPYDRADLPAN